MEFKNPVDGRAIARNTARVLVSVVAAIGAHEAAGPDTGVASAAPAGMEQTQASAPDLLCDSGWTLASQSSETVDGQTTIHSSWDCASPQSSATVTETGPTPSGEEIQPPPQSSKPLPSPTSSTPSSPKPKHNRNSSTSKLKHFSLNMHDYKAPITSNGCGLIALTNAVSFARQERTSVYKVWNQIDGQYTKGGSITMNQYMSKAAPNAARHFGLEVRQISLGQVPKAIRHGSAVIMLAVGGPGNPITHTSHYIEADEVKGNEPRIHDSNQTATRNLNNSYRSISWLRQHGTMNRAWAIRAR